MENKKTNKTMGKRDTNTESKKQEGLLMAKNYSNTNNSNKNSNKNTTSSYGDTQSRNKNSNKNSNSTRSNVSDSRNCGRNMDTFDESDRY